MINYPFKCVYGLMGPPRSGKDIVAKYLQESRDFVSLAFADKIKEEYGISVSDFESAKTSSNIEELRQELWGFSASKKAINPYYFIDLVLEEAMSTNKSVVFTDIRTDDEFNAIFKKFSLNHTAKVYSINHKSFYDGIPGTQISQELCVARMSDIGRIYNSHNGLSAFRSELDHFFFTEDVINLMSYNATSTIANNKIDMVKYLEQFTVRPA